MPRKQEVPVAETETRRPSRIYGMNGGNHLRLILLYKKGALTRDGIRRYLVDRAA
jgi:hypothetical protein